MRPFVSVIVPCRNEVRFIRECLHSILAGDYPAERMEVIVADGMSTDGTREVIEEVGARVRMIDNPELVTPWALNRAILESRGEIILRMDAHARVAPDYVSGCVALLERSGADNAGGVMIGIAQSEGWFAGPILEALKHPFGVGNSRFRIGAGEDQWVDTVFGGCWRRELFSRVGMFHPRLAHSQDMEFNQRLRRAGGRIVLSPAIVSYYYTRSRLGEFARHNFINGVWAVMPFALAGGMPVRWRHLAPLAMVMGLGIAGVADARIAWTMAAAYAAVNLAASGYVAIRRRKWSHAARMPVVFACLHFSYGLGSLWGLVKAIAIRVSKERGIFENGSTEAVR
jgi:glycosyltransferase involved in cell wall biosynthesis